MFNPKSYNPSGKVVQSFGQSRLNTRENTPFLQTDATDYEIGVTFYTVLDGTVGVVRFQGCTITHMLTR